MPNNNDHLFNAAVVGENPESAFLVEGKRLHAVDASVAAQKHEQSDLEKVLPVMREALKALINFSEGKVESHFLEIDWDSFEDEQDEQSQCVHKIHNIYTHLPHHDRNELSSLIHHKAGGSKKR